jgi:hypothetical protein
MNWIKIIFVNFLVFIVTIFFLEIGSRTLLTIKNCYEGDWCDGRFLTSLSLRSKNDLTDIGLVSTHNVLGYVPTPNWAGLIPLYSWNNAKVSIDGHGYRDNDNKQSKTEKMILAVGDSFTFGDQVNNNETWPSCLERETSITVKNGGVFAYGAAQSLLRAQYEISNGLNPDIIIYSILVGHDVKRDQNKIKSGFASPWLGYNDGTLMWNSPPTGIENIVGTHTNPRNNILQYSSIYQYFAALINWMPNMSKTINLSGDPAVKDIDVIQFIFNELENIEQKIIILLQYDGSFNASTQKERELWIKYSNENNFEIIDSFLALHTLDTDSKKLLWNIHHTAAGNEAVCQYIIKNLEFE